MTTDVETIRQSLANDPDNTALKFSLARSLVDAAWSDSSDWSRMYAEARVIYEFLLSNDPDNGIVIVNLGAVLSDQGFHKRALDLYRHAESLGWTDGNLDYNIGVAMMNLRNEKHGIQYLKSSNSKTKHPDTIQAYFDPQAH